MSGQIIAGPMPCAGCGTLVTYGRARYDGRTVAGTYYTHGGYPVFPTITELNGAPHRCTAPDPRPWDDPRRITTRREINA